MRKQMLLRLLAAAFIFWLGLLAPARAQPRDVIEVSYYKIKGGFKAEWLALYKKNHLPILQDHKNAGVLQSVEKEENRRWELTERHWDEVLRPAKLD